MAYIVVKLAGEKKRGGFLRIDGGQETELFDGTTLKLSEGTHHLYYSSQMAAVQASKDLFNSVANGAFNGIGDAMNLELTQHFEANTIMQIEVPSDVFGRISGKPDITMTVVSDEKMQELEQIVQCDEEDKMNEAVSIEKHMVKFYNKLMLFSVLTFFTCLGPCACMIIGYIKQIKFTHEYGKKPKRSGLQGFVSLVCAVAGLVLLSSWL